jgi:5'-nucleotidase
MVVCIDQDEVLAKFLDKWVELYNNEYNDNLTRDDFKSWYVHSYVKEECGHKIYDYLNMESFYLELEPVENSIEVVKKLMDKYEIYIVTAAMKYPNSLRAKYMWLDKYFPFIKKENIVMCGDKSIIRGDILIDDGVHNLEVFKGEKILFTAPHNLDETRFKRANNWIEIRELLL